MKIAITGHTKGIGKALFDMICNDHEVIGFSKSTGYDITNISDRKRIINSVKDCEVFINNAYDGFAQSNMLYELWTNWYTEHKTIINIGSDVTEHTLHLKFKNLLQYQMHKKSLKTLNYDLQNLNTNVSIHYISFGYVGTEQILQKNPPVPSQLIIPLDKAVNKILKVLK
jgi:hypothetical protein